MTDMIIISGMSGSGKSVALQSLEDIGYYCIDNLPAFMLQDFSTRLPERLEGSDGPILPGAAVSIDSRNKSFLSELDFNLNVLEQLGIHFRILFLDAEEQKPLRA